MRVALILMALFASSAWSAQSVWRWKDDQGTVHYSDQPVPGAQRVELNVQTFTPPPAAANQPPPSQQTPSASTYRSLEVWKPAPEEAIINTGGRVSVRVRSDPALASGHSLNLYLDGRRVENVPDTATEFDLTNVSRGTHSIAATITGPDGNVLIQSAPVQFYVQQASVARPPTGPAVKPPPRGTGKAAAQ